MYFNQQCSWHSQPEKWYSHSQSKEKTLGIGNFSTSYSFFQLFLAPLLGQYGLNCVASMFSNSFKLLKGPWGYKKALQYLNPKLLGRKETIEKNQPINFTPETNNEDRPLLVGLNENHNKSEVVSFVPTELYIWLPYVWVWRLLALWMASGAVQ